MCRHFFGLAALLALTGFTAAKPPDLPNNPPIIVATPASPAVTTTILYNVHPFIAYLPQEEPAPCTRVMGQPIQPALQASQCRSVLDNLAALEKATTLLTEAKVVARQGRYSEALERVAIVRALVPGSCCDQQAAAVLAEVVSAMRDAQFQKAFVEALQQIEEEKLAACGGLAKCQQFGLCWATQLRQLGEQLQTQAAAQRVERQRAGWEYLGQVLDQGCVLGFEVFDCFLCQATGCRMPRLINVYSSDPNARMQQLLSSSAELQQLERDWKQIWIEDQPVHLTPERIHGGTSAAPANCCKDGKCCKTEECQQPAVGVKMCHGSECPKCEQLHAAYVKQKQAGIEEQVTGLLKACYHAIEEGHFEKASDLARQAHALDAERVAGDPLMYKFGLFEAKPSEEKCCPEKCCPEKCCPATSKPSNNYPEKKTPSGTLTIGLGINSDVGLTGSIVLNEKNFDAQPAPKKCEGCKGCCHQFSLADVWAVARAVYATPLVPTNHDQNCFKVGLSSSGNVDAFLRAKESGVVYNLLFKDGVFLIWMTPEAKTTDTPR